MNGRWGVKKGVIGTNSADARIESLVGISFSEIRLGRKWRKLLLSVGSCTRRSLDFSPRHVRREILSASRYTGASHSKQQNR